MVPKKPRLDNFLETGIEQTAIVKSPSMLPTVVQDFDNDSNSFTPNSGLNVQESYTLGDGQNQTNDFESQGFNEEVRGLPNAASGKGLSNLFYDIPVRCDLDFESQQLTEETSMEGCVLNFENDTHLPGAGNGSQLTTPLTKSGKLESFVEMFRELSVEDKEAAIPRLVETMERSMRDQLWNMLNSSYDSEERLVSYK